MQKFRSDSGYTMIEILTVMAIVGIMTTMAVSTFKNYARHEDTRRAANSVASVLSTARTQAMVLGNMSFVVFAQPLDGSILFAPNQYAALVLDTNGSGAIENTDSITPIFLPGTNPDVTGYGAHGNTVLKETALPEADESQQVPGGDLTNLISGTTMNVDPLLGAPVIAFSSQGTPVTIQNSDDWGAGAGAAYVTDNDQLLFAVVVQPLGDIKTLAWDSASQSWK